MLFSTTACPRCGKKIDKSDLLIVETKIKTIVKCCPECIKYIDVKRRINPKKIPIGKREPEKGPQPQADILPIKDDDFQSKPEPKIQEDNTSDDSDPLDLLKEIKGESKQDDNDGFLRKSPWKDDKLNIELETPEKKPGKITSTSDVFDKPEENAPTYKEGSKLEKQEILEPIDKKTSEKIETTKSIIEEEFEPEIDPIIEEPEPEKEKIEPETIDDEQSLEPQEEPEKETEEDKEEKTESIDEKMELSILDLKILKKLKETGTIDIETLSEELKIEPDEIFNSLTKLKDYGICKEKEPETKKEKKTIAKPEPIKTEEIEKEIDTKIQPKQETIEPEKTITIEKNEPEPIAKEEKTIAKPEPIKTEEIEKVEKIHKEIDESPFQQTKKLSIADEKSQRIRKDWQAEWIVTSKEAENIISSAVEKKEKSRKKKFIPIKFKKK